MYRRALYLAQMLRNESRPAADLLQRQDRRLSALVRHAASRVPFYRELYAAHGVDPRAVAGVHDLQRLPIIDKPMLRAAGAAALSLDAPARRVTITTSGSSGEPFRFEIDRRHDQWRKAQYLRPYLGNGRRLRDRVLRLTAFPRAGAPWFTRFGLLNETQFDCGADPALVADAWRSLAPAVLQGYPSALRSLAHYCLQRGVPLLPAPRLVFTDSELLTADTRRLLERQFGVPVIDIFGTYETDNIAYQCGIGGGYHIAGDSVVLEIVRDGRSMPAGEDGEIVVTVLGNRTSPFIRYNLHDRGQLAPAACACGRPWPLLTGLTGRADDLILLADGRQRTPMDALGRLDMLGESMRQYQLRQRGIADFQLLIVPSTRFVEADRERIVAAIMAALGEVRVELQLVDQVAADRSGKRRAFVAFSPDP